MQTTVENTSTLGRRMTIAVPFKDLTVAEEQKLNELSKTVQVPGFRKGKASKSVVQQRFAQQITQQALEQIINNSLPKALQEAKLSPVGNPVIEKIIKENGKDIQYIVNFEIYPEISLSDFSEIQLKKYKVNLTESEIDTMLTKLQSEFANWRKTEGPAKLTDRVTVDYTSTINGEPYENSAAEDVAVELGGRMFIQGFEEGLVACRVGDTRVLDLQFPSNWRIEKLANKSVQFKITVKKLEEKVSADLDEQFAKKIGAKNVDDIRSTVQKQLLQQAEKRADERLKEDVKEALIKANPVPLPKTLIEREVSMLHEDLHRKMGDKAANHCEHVGLEDEAAKRVALGLILRQVVQEEKIEPIKQRVTDRIKQISLQFSSPDVVESMYYESDELLKGVSNTVLVEQAIEFVLTKIKTVDTPITLEELLKGTR